MRRALALVVLTVACHRAAPPSSPRPAPGATSAQPTTAAVSQLTVAVANDPVAVAAIKRAGADRARHRRDMQYLADVMAPGSPGAQRSESQRLDGAEIPRVRDGQHLAGGEWHFGRSWERGPMTLRMLEPHQRWLDGVSWAWSPGTNGPLAGNVLVVDAKTAADFTAHSPASQERGDGARRARQPQCRKAVLGRLGAHRG